MMTVQKYWRFYNSTVDVDSNKEAHTTVRGFQQDKGTEKTTCAAHKDR